MSRRPGLGAGWVVSISVALVALAALALCAVVVVVRPPLAVSLLEAFGVSLSSPSTVQKAADGTRAEDRADTVPEFASFDDRVPTAAEAALLGEQERRARQTPLLARYDSVDLRSPIACSDVTGVLFHQASYGYALPLETALPEADYETAANAHSIRVNRDQDAASEDWMDAEALHLWRTADVTAMDTSIDVGALAGTEVRAPVSGTVVLVRDYMLYDELPDIEVHIQPEGRPDLDCVLIHLSDAMVKAGDRVEAGITPIARVRNIEEFLTDVQLAYFTPEGTGGNHAHVQLNDAGYPGYRESRLEGALAI